MSCPIEIHGVNGFDPSPTGVLSSVVISGRVTNGRTGCDRVQVKLVSPPASIVETSIDDDGGFEVTIDVSSLPDDVEIKCGSWVKLAARCSQGRCDPVEGDFEVRCLEDDCVGPQYVSYYDCTGWDSVVEVMNIQNYDASFIITLYHRGGIQAYQANILAHPHETKRIQLIDRLHHVRFTEGLVIVAPVNTGDEFPSMLCITNESIPSGLPITTNQLQRFVPFIRVPYERRVRG